PCAAMEFCQPDVKISLFKWRGEFVALERLQCELRIEIQSCRLSVNGLIPVATWVLIGKRDNSDAYAVGQSVFHIGNIRTQEWHCLFCFSEVQQPVTKRKIKQ